MNQHILANDFLNYITNLQIGQNINDWICQGKTDITYGSPNGGWDGVNGFLFVKEDNSHSYVIRSIPRENTGSYIVIESLNIKGQLYNMDLSNPRICKEIQGKTYLLESYRMTVGKGKKREIEVENSFKSFGINTNEVTVIEDLKPNWEKTLTDILDWAILREKVKILLKENNKKLFKANYKDAYSNWLDTKVPTNSGSKSSYIRSIDLLSETIGYLIFEENDIEKLIFLYNDLIVEQRVESGKYWNEKYSSYGLKGFYSAAINSYCDFLKDYFSKNTIMETSNFTAPLNQILYGPPGTGKTYNTINKALSIIESKTIEEINLETRNVLKTRFEDYIKNGQIVFTTFHQSMSYEDFIEGIKPKITEDGEENKQVIYEIEDGIFKQIVESAKKERTTSKEIIEKYSFDDAWDDLYNESEKLIENKKSLTLTIQTPNLGLGVVEVTERGNLKLKPIYSEQAKTYIVSYDRAKKLQEVFPDLSVIKNIDKEFRAVIGGSNSTAYWSVLNYINNKISESSKISNTESEPKLLPHVLIIDEINRGNVSQIFGELITLIEEDKRLGKDEKLEVTLPYSKKKFGVPSNLYIIGTMNTADRSVEALDTALRRRFCFEEMPPLYDLDELQNQIFGYKASKILKTVNSRIEKLIDKDHKIGHSYLLDKDENSVVDSFYKNIIPLLQEYFFGDYGKLGLVLGKGFVYLKEWNKGTDTFADFDDDASNDFDSKNVYEIIDYRKIKDHKIGSIEMTFEKAVKVLMKDSIE